MKKDKKKVIKETIHLLIKSSVLLFIPIVYFIVSDYYTGTIDYMGYDNQQLYTVSGTSSDIYVTLKHSRHRSKSVITFVIDEVKYDIDMSHLPFSSSNEKYKEFEKSCKTHGLTIQYMENCIGKHSIASLTLLENNETVVDLDDMIKYNIQRRASFRVPYIVLSAIILGLWCIYNWHGIKVIYNIIKKKGAKAKRKAEREKIFSKQDSQ